MEELTIKITRENGVFGFDVITDIENDMTIMEKIIGVLNPKVYLYRVYETPVIKDGEIIPMCEECKSGIREDCVANKITETGDKCRYCGKQNIKHKGGKRIKSPAPKT